MLGEYLAGDEQSARQEPPFGDDAATLLEEVRHDAGEADRNGRLRLVADDEVSRDSILRVPDRAFPDPAADPHRLLERDAFARHIGRRVDIGGPVLPIGRPSCTERVCQYVSYQVRPVP